MVRWYHVILSFYGFWLPNDPRGSWSTWVGSWDLYRYGPATKVNDRRSHASDEHDRRKRLEAKQGLRYPPVTLTGEQARAVGLGFRDVCAKSRYLVHACAILPEDAHLVIARHRYQVEQVVRRLKQAATISLKESKLHPEQPTVWGMGMWKCYIDNERYLHSAIRYVENNPTKEGKRRQQWSFVTAPYLTRG